MSQPKIQTLVTLIRSRAQILHPLLLIQRIPLPLAPPVLPEIVRLCQEIYGNVRRHQGYKGPVPTAIPWTIVLAVDVRGNNAR